MKHGIIAVLLVALWGQVLITGGYIIMLLTLNTIGEEYGTVLPYIFTPFTIAWICVIVLTLFLYSAKLHVKGSGNYDTAE